VAKGVLLQPQRRAGCGLIEEKPCSLKEAVASYIRVSLVVKNLVVKDMQSEVLSQ
jgi:hypothetical protein